MRSASRPSCISVLVTEPIQGQMKFVGRAHSRFLSTPTKIDSDVPGAAGSYVVLLCCYQRNCHGPEPRKYVLEFNAHSDIEPEAISTSLSP